MKHFLSLRDFSVDEILALISRAKEIKARNYPSALRNKIMGMLFFKQSLRTRTSFEAGMIRAGGGTVTLSVGTDTWGIETIENAVMDAGFAEHVRETAPVLSRYCDVLGVRSGPKLQSIEEDLNDTVLNGFSTHATVPVINMESNMEHPCQAVADIMTISEKFTQTKKKKFVLTWLPQLRTTPLATAHSISMVGGFLGMDVTIVHPPGYELMPEYTEFSKKTAESTGGSFKIEKVKSGAERDEISRGADIVYGKSWGAPRLYGNTVQQSAEFKLYRDFKVSLDSIGESGNFMHCLPVRRNVKVDDAVLNSSKSIVVDQAENRMWGQLAILEKVLT